jgi:large subunit ribosomal protein L2
MAVIKMKPTSPGMRGMVKISRDHLHKGEPYALLNRNSRSLAVTQQRSSRFATKAAVTSTTTVSWTSSATRTIPAKVERIEYDPNRTAHIAL